MYADDVWDLIVAHRGRSQAVTAREIARVVGGDDRTVRDAVEHLRGSEGKPIMSASRHPAGYFVPATSEEVKESIAQIRSRIKKMEVTVASMEHTLRSMSV